MSVLRSCQRAQTKKVSKDGQEVGLVYRDCTIYRVHNSKIHWTARSTGPACSPRCDPVLDVNPLVSGVLCALDHRNGFVLGPTIHLPFPRRIFLHIVPQKGPALFRDSCHIQSRKPCPATFLHVAEIEKERGEADAARPLRHLGQKVMVLLQPIEEDGKKVNPVVTVSGTILRVHLCESRRHAGSQGAFGSQG
jgi:hypothetical protein